MPRVRPNVTTTEFRNFAARTVATWFGCGKWPWGPGTAGSLGAIIPLLPMLGIAYEGWRTVVMLLLAVLLAPGIWASARYEQLEAKKDPGAVVVDEVLGQWLTLAFATKLSWASLGLGFVLFRVFDIVKPFPVRQAERFPGGVGIVADDLAAGVFAGIVLFFAGWFNLY
ncbi:MAG: phosphatidylglycerophosphatase A [Bryobacterales bacterium]|nr:phosphatidylglycerophosphatase A [Bryobacterales bacterium]